MKTIFTEKQLKTKSKFLSLVLRHRPELIGLILNEQGWTSVETLLEKLQVSGHSINRNMLEAIVENNNKKRFAFNENQTMIRANQGHSINIDLGYQASEPPEFLYHGTAQQHLESILRKGIEKRQRHHVHLSAELETAHSVGSRHGKPVILKIQAQVMAQAGIPFYRSENGVWLTEYVAPEYILQE